MDPIAVSIGGLLLSALSYAAGWLWRHLRGPATPQPADPLAGLLSTLLPLLLSLFAPEQPQPVAPPAPGPTPQPDQTGPLRELLKGLLARVLTPPPKP